MAQLSDYELRRHTVLVDGLQTSVSIEDAFWSRLREIAAARRISMNKLVSEVRREAACNLSAALRVYALRYPSIADELSEIGQVQAQVHPITTGTSSNV